MLKALLSAKAFWALCLGILFSALIISRFLTPGILDDYARLELVIGELNLKPIEVRIFQEDSKYQLGKALFYDPVLSGRRTVACATCHLFSHGLSDGLPKSIGVGGKGLGPARTLAGRESEHRHNSLDLLNRDHQAVRSLFWDGRVELIDPIRKLYRSPVGRLLPEGFENPMAVQAVLPIITSDEMLGFDGDVSPADLPKEHATQINELATGITGEELGSRYSVVGERLMKRLLGSDRPGEWQLRYRSLFEAAYPGKKSFSLVDVANAIAHYEELAFATDSSRWDRFLKNREQKNISADAVKGALLFFGKGRCAVCHSGPLFSDFQFYSVGIYESHDLEVSRRRDMGRAYATGDPEDMYKFRTPLLRNVTNTGPYFHDGSSTSLHDAIARHVSPLRDAGKYDSSGAHKMAAEQIDAVSRLVQYETVLSEDEIRAVVAFLRTLEYEPRPLRSIIPKTVPSGLPVVYSAEG